MAARVDSNAMVTWLGLILILLAARLTRGRHRLLQRSQLIRATVVDLKPWTTRPRGAHAAVVQVTAGDGRTREVRVNNLVGPTELALGAQVYVALVPPLSASIVEEVWLVRWRHLFAVPRILLAVGLFTALVGLATSGRPLGSLWTPSLFSCVRDHHVTTDRNDQRISIDASWSCDARLAPAAADPPPSLGRGLLIAGAGLAAIAVYLFGANGARRGDASLRRRYHLE